MCKQGIKGKKEIERRKPHSIEMGLNAMELKEKILNYLRNECKLIDELSVDEYIMKRKDSILQNHIDNVYPIKTPGEGWKDQRYYWTKLTPQCRGHEHKIYAKTQEELETKIVAYYLNILDDRKLTLEKILLTAIQSDRPETGLRKYQRFCKWFSSLRKCTASNLTESKLRDAIEEMRKKEISKKEFNNAIGVLNTIADYCAYEHIDIIDIRAVIATYRRFKLKGKRDFKPVQKQDLDLAFTKEEAQKIVVYALSHPSYNAFAVAIMITTGLRASELLGLETEDVDLCKGRIWVHQMECTKTYDIEQDCKDHSIRYVYLTPDAELVLSKAVDYRLEDESISPFLLLNPCSSDGKLHLRAIDHYLREYVHHEILGLSHDRNARSCHDCRRTYASLEYLSGTDIRTIKQQMGHNTEQQTWDYIHEVIDAEERKNRLKGGNLLGNSQKPHKYALDAV